MNDYEDLRLAAGRALNLTLADMKYFSPLSSEAQTLNIARKLYFTIHVDFAKGKTTVTHLNESIVEDHAQHSDPSIAFRYCVLRMAASIGKHMPIVPEEPFVFTTVTEPPRKQVKSAKHGIRITKELVVNE
jgi:hypothetical protein